MSEHTKISQKVKQNWQKKKINYIYFLFIIFYFFYMLEISDKKILILDYDGVIIDSSSRYAQAFYKIIKNYWYNLSFEEARHYSKSKHHLSQLIQDSEVIEKVLTDFWNELGPDTNNILINNVIETLKEIKEEFYIALFTDRKKQSLLSSLDFFWVQNSIDYQVSVCDSWEKKPSPKWIHMIWKYFQANIENIIAVVWDSCVDQESAINAWVPFIGVLSWVNTKEDWENKKSLYIPDLTHLPEYLKNTWN